MNKHYIAVYRRPVLERIELFSGHRWGLGPATEEDDPGGCVMSGCEEPVAAADLCLYHLSTL